MAVETIANAGDSFVIVGVGWSPIAPPAALGTAQLVGPVGSAHALITETAKARAPFVALQREHLPSDWLRSAVDLLGTDPAIAAVVVSGTECEPDRSAFAAVGAGLLLRSSVLHEVGGFHDLGDDVACLGTEADLQWRIAARGYRVATLPCGPSGCYPKRLELPTRLALMADNLDPETLGRCLPAFILAAVTSPLQGSDTAALDLQRSPGGDDVGALSVAPEALAGAREVIGLSRALPAVSESRIATQSTRRVSDRVLAGPIAAFLSETAEVARVTEDISAALPWTVDPDPRMHVLVLLSPSVATEVPGWIADFTSAAPDLEVTSQVVEGSTGEKPMGADPDVVVLVGVYLRQAPWVAKLGVPVVSHLGNWGYQSDLTRDVVGLVRGGLMAGLHAQLLVETIQRSDLVAVGDEVQRDELLGLMAGCGRVNDRLYDEDASLRSVVDVLTPGQVAEWCTRPRRAVDLVHTFLAPEGAQDAPAGVLDRIKGPLSRLRRPRS